MKNLEILKSYLNRLRELLKDQKFGYPVYNIRLIFSDPFYGLVARQIESASNGDMNTIQTQDWEFIHQKQLGKIPDYKDFDQAGLLDFVESSIEKLQNGKFENENDLKKIIQELQDELREFRENREIESLNGRKLPIIQGAQPVEDGFLS